MGFLRGLQAASTRTGSPTILQAMFSVRPKSFPRDRSDTKPLLLGAAVRLRGREGTGLIIGKAPDIDRVAVRWDDTGEVTHCLKAKLELVR